MQIKNNPGPTHLARCPLWWCQHQRGWAPPPSPLLQCCQPARQTVSDTILQLHLITASHCRVNCLSYHDGVFGELSSDRLDKLHKVLRVAIGHIQTDVLEGGDSFQDGAQLLQVCIAAAWAGSHMLWRKATIAFKGPLWIFFKKRFIMFFCNYVIVFPTTYLKKTLVMLPLSNQDD